MTSPASPEPEEDVVLEEEADGILTLTLNRPQRLNAVSPELYRRLDRALASLRRRPEVRVVILTGAGRGFSVGADLKAHGEGELDDAFRSRYILLAQRVNLRIQRSPVPVVAAVNGHAVGAGLELALSADLMVVAEEAKLRLPEVALGTFFGGGVTYTLPARVGLTRAREILLLARFFSGTDAAAWGLANQALPAPEVLPAALGLARELATMAPISLRQARELLRDAPHQTPTETLRAEGAALFRCMQTDDWKEGIEAFHDRRTPRYHGR
jgi:enoyl-CoA hydratase